MLRTSSSDLSLLPAPMGLGQVLTHHRAPVTHVPPAPSLTYESAGADTLSADGAITLGAGVAFITKSSLAALTLAAPSSQDGRRLTITSTTDFAHRITISSGFWDGTAGVNTLVTYSAVRGSSITLVAYGTLWYVESQNQVTCT